MSNAKQTRYVTSRSRETLLHTLETLSDAFFFIDDTETIVYANASAQSMLGAPLEALCGKNFWDHAPHLVSIALYQAVLTTLQTRESMEVEYMSPVTRNWLHVQLAPTVGGLTLHFHEKREPTRSQGTIFPEDHLAVDVLENLYVEVGFLTPEGILLEINETLLKDAQIRREEVIGKPFAVPPWWSFAPESQYQLRAAITRASLGETVRFETLVHRREGMDLHLEATITPHRDVDHHVAYLVYVGSDITERKRAEGEIHALIDALPQLVWIARPDGEVTYHNQRLIDYLAMTLEQVKGTGWMAGVHPDDRHQTWRAWQASIQTGEPYEVEQRLQDGTSGAYRWFLIRGVPQRNAQGTILHWVGTSTDIDEQKQAEARVKASEENWRVLAETMPQLVWIGQLSGAKEYFNQRWFDYIHTTPEQMRETGWLQFLHPDDYERTMAFGRHARETGEPYEMENRFRESQTGTYRWFLSRALPVRDKRGQIVKWFGTCTDIEEQKRTEEALRQSQERAQALLESSIIGIVVVEDDETLVEANEAFLQMTGYTREELQNGTLRLPTLIHPDDAPRGQQAVRELAVSQQVKPYETTYVCRDGSLLPVLMGGVTLPHHPSQAIGFLVDNSARKELEQRKDDFISMAGHELKTPLTALKMQAQLVRKRLEKQGLTVAAAALSKIEGPVKQLERLIAELLDVSKIQAGRLDYIQESVDLEALLQEVADTLHQMNPTYTIAVHGTAPCPLVGDPGRLEQVFTNLISNAIKYSPDAHTVEIDLSSSTETAVIRVRDYGLGIPREQRDKIFERFYRAAGPRQQAIPGLGMGLYIVAEIIARHGGTITVESEVGKGSTFTVTLLRQRDT